MVAQSAGPPAQPIHELLAGTAYQHVRRLGAGGMGEVHVVENKSLGAQYALKVLRPDLVGDPQLTARMRREALSLGQLVHPNIVDVIDFWISPVGWPCIVMELLKGHTLGQTLAARHTLPPREALEIAIQVASALGAAHEMGVIHRDVALDNLFLHEVRGYPVKVKVLDFGIARRVAFDDQTPDSLGIRTATGALIGTPAFMSPEAARGEPVDARADLFSLGVVLYVMLVGHGPFDLARVRPPSHYEPGISAQLDAVVLRAIEESKEQRYQSAEELRLDLERQLRALKSGTFPRSH